MSHKRKATIVVLVCQGETEAIEELTKESADRLEQATSELGRMFRSWKKRVICSGSMLAMTTGEVLEKAFNAHAAYISIFEQPANYNALVADVEMLDLQLDAKMVNFVVVPQDVFRTFVEIYSRKKYGRLLEIKKDPEGGDVAIFDDLEETLQEMHFTPRQNEG